MPAGTSYSPISVEQYTSKALHLNGRAIRLTAAARSVLESEKVTSVDLKITDDMVMNGGIFICSGYAIEDGFTVQVVDVDGVFPNPATPGTPFPAGTVLLTPYDDWAPYSFIQVSNPYPTKLYANLYIRLSYRNTQLTPVKAVFNIPFNKILF